MKLRNAGNTGRRSMRTLELDHVFCMVSPSDDWAARLQQAGWLLDVGREHAGQGTRNRCVVWPEHYLELLWVANQTEAETNPVRLDRRADWARSGASPFGFGLRGQLAENEIDDYWRYDALGPTIWIHRDNERRPERPLVFVVDVPTDELEHHRPQNRFPHLPAHRRPGTLQRVHMTGPAAPSLPRYTGPPVEHAPGAHRLELAVGDGPARKITDLLLLTG
jgi:glyoxalase-like protein